jgi:c-di-GMP-binding flagellar brake protein YcgR
MADIFHLRGPRSLGGPVGPACRTIGHPLEVYVSEEPIEQTEEVPPEVQERRSSYRLNKVLGAEIEHEGMAFNARLFVIDISTTGFKASNEHELPVDCDLKVKVVLQPKTEPISSTARIVWSKHLPASGMHQFGFQFLELAEGDDERLEKFIESHRAAELSNKQTDVYLGRPWTTIR